MIILNWPLSISSLHKSAYWYGKALLHPLFPGKQGACLDRGKINFVYFSYRPDFECLMYSIRSLLRHVPAGKLGKIYIAEDQKLPFLDEQRSIISDLYEGIRMHPISNFSWGSAESTLAEIEFFKQVSDDLDSDCDFMAKIDSDVVLFGGQKLVRLLESNLQAVGDGHFVGYRYAQGGLYLIRKALIDSVLSPVRMDDVLESMDATGLVGEDVSISYLLEKSGHPFFLTRLMLFPLEYNRIKKINGLVRGEFVGAYFHKDKENLIAYCDRHRFL